MQLHKCYKHLYSKCDLIILMQYKVAAHYYWFCVRSEGSVLCQGCEAENLVSEESTLSNNTVCS